MANAMTYWSTDNDGKVCLPLGGRASRRALRGMGISAENRAKPGDKPLWGVTVTASGASIWKCVGAGYCRDMAEDAAAELREFARA